MLHHKYVGSTSYTQKQYKITSFFGLGKTSSSTIFHATIPRKNSHERLRHGTKHESRTEVPNSFEQPEHVRDIFSKVKRDFLPATNAQVVPRASKDLLIKMSSPVLADFFNSWGLPVSGRVSSMC